MKSVIERVKKYRFNKQLIKNVYEKKRMGLWDKQSLKIIAISANVVLLTFIIRFFSRVYMMYEMEGTDLATFFHRKYLILVIWLIIYAVFANYLLGIGNTDRNIKIYSTRYVKTLVFLIIYVIEIFISLFFFINGIYDYKILSIIWLRDFDVPFRFFKTKHFDVRLIIINVKYVFITLTNLFFSLPFQ